MTMRIFGITILQVGIGLVQFLGTSATANAGVVTLNFEGLPDSTILTTQYPGLTFSNTVILTAGISLNEFEFPPYSGVNVASDDTGPISITFASPVLSFGGYFTYADPLTLDGFNAADALVASATSVFSDDEALSGDLGSSPNEFIQIAFGGGISSVTITGGPLGGSFTLDNATYVSAGGSVPEPATLIPGLMSILVLFLYSKKRITRHP